MRSSGASNGAKVSDRKGGLLKLALICLACIGLVTGLALLVRAVVR